VDASKRIEYQEMLLGLVPGSGENVGNVTLREQLRAKIEGQGDQLADEDYWLLRDSLIDQGLLEQGRGRGGSVHRLDVSGVNAALQALGLPPDSQGVPSSPSGRPTSVSPSIGIPEAPQEVPAGKAEARLYEPFHSAIRDGYTKDNRLKRFISELTANQGRRATGGKWTRPDLTLISVRTYQFTPGKRIEVITFEVKPNLDDALEGVYEALAHSAFAHRSYLAVDTREFKDIDEVPDDRIVQECTRHGVGYIAFEDVADYNTYEIVCPAKLKEPDPEEVDTFIKKQISQLNQEELREFLQ
jgi:hypothetical protein